MKENTKNQGNRELILFCVRFGFFGQNNYLKER
jgi:hypothetical protein